VFFFFLPSLNFKRNHNKTQTIDARVEAVLKAFWTFLRAGDGLAVTGCLQRTAEQAIEVGVVYSKNLAWLLYTNSLVLPRGGFVTSHQVDIPYLHNSVVLLTFIF
jgi:hypothetical protein